MAKARYGWTVDAYDGYVGKFESRAAAIKDAIAVSRWPWDDAETALDTDLDWEVLT